MGWGFDTHRFGSEPPVILGGVVVDASRGVEAHSDGDVVAHALADAILGIAGRGDMGEHFPSSDPRWMGADSMVLLRRCLEMARESGVVPSFCDITVVGNVRVAPHRDAIVSSVATVLDLDRSAVSVKATTTDGMGFAGRDEGLAAVAVVTGLFDRP